MATTGSIYLNTSQSVLLPTDGYPEWILKLIHTLTLNGKPLTLFNLATQYEWSFNPKHGVKAEEVDYLQLADYTYNLIDTENVRIEFIDWKGNQSNVSPYHFAFEQLRQHQMTSVNEVRSYLKLIAKHHIYMSVKDYLSDWKLLVTEVRDDSLVLNWGYESLWKINGQDDLYIATQAHGADCLVLRNGRWSFPAHSECLIAQEIGNKLAHAKVKDSWHVCHSSEKLLDEWIVDIIECLSKKPYQISSSDIVEGNDTVSAYLHGRGHLFAMAFAELNPDVEILYDWNPHTHRGRGEMLHTYCRYQNQLFDMRGVFDENELNRELNGNHQQLGVSIEYETLKTKCSNREWGEPRSLELKYLKSFIKNNLSFYPAPIVAVD